MKITYTPFGAQMIITITGTPDEVQRKVNLFASYGMYKEDAIDPAYKPGESCAATVRSTPAKVKAALQAMAEVKLAKRRLFCQRLKGKPGSVFKEYAKRHATKLFKQFQKVNEGEIKERELSMEHYYDVTSESNPEWMRKIGKKLLGIYAASK